MQSPSCVPSDISRLKQATMCSNNDLENDISLFELCVHKRRAMLRRMNSLTTCPDEAIVSVRKRDNHVDYRPAPMESIACDSTPPRKPQILQSVRHGYFSPPQVFSITPLQFLLSGFNQLLIFVEVLLSPSSSTFQ